MESAKSFLGILLLIPLIFSLGTVTATDSQPKEYLLNYLVQNLSYDNASLSVLDEGHYSLQEISFYYVKVVDGMGHKGIYHLETDSLTIFDHKPSVHEIFGAPEKVEEDLFLLMRTKGEDEGIDVLIQFEGDVAQEDVDGINQTGMLIERVEGRFIFATGTKQQIIDASDVQKVQLIAANIPAKAEERNGEISVPSLGPSWTILGVAIFGILILAIFYLRRNKNGDIVRGEENES